MKKSNQVRAVQFIKELVDEGYSPDEIVEVSNEVESKAYEYKYKFDSALNKAQYDELYRK